MKSKNVKLVACLSLTGFLALCGLPCINDTHYNMGIMESQAAEITNTWDSGNTTVTLDSEGTLTIEAKSDTDGRMADNSLYGPWYSSKASINKIVVMPNVTYIGRCSFYELIDENMEFILPDIDGWTVEYGELCFGYCTIADINPIIDSIKDNKIPKSLFKSTTINNDFIDLGRFEHIESEAFNISSSSPNIPEITLGDNIKYLGNNAFGYFGYSNRIKKVNLPRDISNIEFIGKGIFDYFGSVDVAINAPKATIYVSEASDLKSLNLKAKKVYWDSTYTEFKLPNLETLNLDVQEEIESNRLITPKLVIANIKCGKYPDAEFEVSDNKCYSIPLLKVNKDLNPSINIEAKEIGKFAFYNGHDVFDENYLWNLNNNHSDFYIREGNIIHAKYSFPVTVKGNMERINDYAFSFNDSVTFENNTLSADVIGIGAFKNTNINAKDLLIKTEALKDNYSFSVANPEDIKLIIQSSFTNKYSTFTTFTKHKDITLDNTSEDGMFNFTLGSGALEKLTIKAKKDVNIQKIWGTASVLKEINIETEEEGGFLTLGTQLFKNSPNMNVLNISDNIMGLKLGKSPFSGCSTSLKLPNKPIYEVGFHGFNGLSELGTVTILADSLADEAFYGANSGKIIAKNLKTIGNLAFANSTNLDLSEVDLTTVQSIGNGALESYFNIDNCTFESLETIGESVFYNMDCSTSYFPNLKNVGVNGFRNSNITTENVDVSKLESYENSSFYDTNIDKIRIGKDTYFNPKAFNTLETIYVMNDVEAFNYNLSTIPTLKKIYMLGNIASAMTKSNIPSTTMVYCIKGSTTETWCKNNSVAYTLLTDEEVDELINGKLPTIQQDSFMYDGTVEKDIKLTVSLGEKPAGADGIDKVLIDNEELDTASWEFNGTDKITIFNEELAKLTNGTHTISVLFNNDTFRSGAVVTVINSTQGNDSSQPPDALVTIKYEFYKDYPDHVIIPVKLNGATQITKLKIGTQEVDSSVFELQDGAIIIDKDYLSSLDVGKYRILPTFNDKDKTTISNIQLIIYEKASDRAAPYLLQSRIVFNGSSVSLSFDPGEGDLETTNVLALVLDDELILPNGDKVPFNSNNTNKLQKAYEEYINIEEIASPSNAKKESNTNNKDNENIDSKDSNINEDETINNDNNKNIDSEDTNINEDETINNENDKTNINDTKETNTNKDNIDNEDTNINKDETVNNEDNEFNKEEDNLIKVDVEQVESNSFNLFAALDDYDKVFVTNGTEIVLDGAYIESLNLSEGDHLIGAIFDNTERTTDVKKVILTIPKTDSEDKPTPPDDGDKEEPVNPPKPDEEDKPTPPDNGDKEEPVEPPKPDEGNKPTPPDNNNGGGSSGGGSSSGGSNSKPDNSKPSPINPDGSLNPDYKPVVPDTGGKFEGNGDDWTYIKPDGSQAKNEWVGDGKDWYYIDENSKLKYDWALINGEWYMLNREHDGKFGAAKYGWYKESQDGQWYFMNPKDTKMLTGWQKINHKWYYFNINQGEPTYYGDNQSGWKYDATKVAIRPHGSMYANEITPDGYKINEKGEWIE